MHIHPAATVATALLLIAGIAVAVRGETRARDLERHREDILAALPGRAREIRRELLDASLDMKSRESLETELRHCEKGWTGIPDYFAHNARLNGYGWGLALAVMGLICLFYKPKATEQLTAQATSEG